MRCDSIIHTTINHTHTQNIEVWFPVHTRTHTHTNTHNARVVEQEHEAGRDGVDDTHASHSDTHTRQDGTAATTHTHTSCRKRIRDGGRDGTNTHTTHTNSNTGTGRPRRYYEHEHENETRDGICFSIDGMFVLSNI